MLYDELKYHRSDIERLKKLSPDSKEYKQTFSALRIALGRYAVQDFKSAKKGEPLYFYKKEYYLRVLISAALMLIAVLIFVFIFTVFGNSETDKNENLLICILLVVALLLSFVALGVGLTVQTLTDKYLKSSMQRFESENNAEDN